MIAIKWVLLLSVLAGSAKIIFAAPSEAPRAGAVQEDPKRDLTDEPVPAEAKSPDSENSRGSAMELGGQDPPPPPPFEGGEKPAAQLAGFAPRVRLARIEGCDDDAAYIRSVAERASELVASTAKAENPVDRIDILLAAANLILAHQLEPACSTTLLKIAHDEDVWKTAELREALDRVDSLIEQASNGVEALRGQEEEPADRLDDSAHRLETLGAFALAMRVYLLPEEGDGADQSVRRAASRLSPLLEDQSRPVAAAASLWQACLRSSDSDPTRALSVLDLALAKPPEQSMPYAFFARLQRCRVIADRGGSAAALALLLQIEERCDTWLTSDTERIDAMRASQLLQLQVLTNWHNRLGSSAEQDSERKWCADRIKGLREAAFDGDDNTVLRMTPAVPIIAHAPDLEAPAPEETPEGG